VSQVDGHGIRRRLIGKRIEGEERTGICLSMREGNFRLIYVTLCRPNQLAPG